MRDGSLGQAVLIPLPFRIPQHELRAVQKLSSSQFSSHPASKRVPTRKFRIENSQMLSLTFSVSEKERITMKVSHYIEINSIQLPQVFK
uniref:Uncharacterized protein n=1 Tax=Arion vulgaris TaxID=1028688 RepID=A0A0B7AUF9_9EUPU